jgi:hypothetical protein
MTWCAAAGNEASEYGLVDSLQFGEAAANDHMR